MNIRLFGLSAVFLLGACFRFSDLGNVPPGLWYDEAVNGNSALAALRTGDFRVFYSGNYGREGLYINLQALFLSFLPCEPWTLRFVSAVFGVLTIPGLYLLARELFEFRASTSHASRKRAFRVALLSSFLLSISFWHIIFSREAYRRVLAPFFLVWALGLLLYSAKKRGVLVRCVLAGLAGLLFGLGFHSYLAFRVAPLVLLALVPLLGFRKSNRDIACSMLAGTLLAVLPIACHFMKYPNHFSERLMNVSVLASPDPLSALGDSIIRTLGMLHFSGSSNWRFGIAGQPLLSLPEGLLFLAGLCILLGALWGRRHQEDNLEGAVLTRRSAFFLGSWLLIGLVPAFASIEGAPHSGRALLATAPVVMIIAIGFDQVSYRLRAILKRFSLSNLHLPVVFCCLVFLSFSAYRRYFSEWAEDPRTARAFLASEAETARSLRQFPIETPKFIVVENNCSHSPEVIKFLTGVPESLRKSMFFVQSGEVPVGEGIDGVVARCDQENWTLQSTNGE